jgi:hypothetical protein
VHPATVQPVVMAPLNITAIVTPFHLDSRITVVEFENLGNTDAPRQLSRAVLVPIGVIPPAVLKLCPNQREYPVPVDGVVSQITITIGEQPAYDSQILVLVAVLDIESIDGTLRHLHACAQLD